MSYTAKKPKIYFYSMNTGKQICEILKSIRKDIAESYGLKYEPTDCGFTGNCLGFFFLFDAEIRDLERQLKEKHHGVIGMIYNDFSQEVSNRCVDLISTINKFEHPEYLMGGIRPCGDMAKEAEKEIPKKIYHK